MLVWADLSIAVVLFGSFEISSLFVLPRHATPCFFDVVAEKLTHSRTHALTHTPTFKRYVCPQLFIPALKRVKGDCCVATVVSNLSMLSKDKKNPRQPVAGWNAYDKKQTCNSDSSQDVPSTLRGR